MNHIKIFDISKFGFLLLTMLIILMGCSSLATGPQTYTMATTYPAPPINHQEEIEFYEDILKQDLSEEDRERIESLKNETSILLTMEAAPTASRLEIDEAMIYATSLAQSTPIPKTGIELGIFTSGIFFEVHVPRRVDIANIWQGYDTKGNLMRVYAGLLKPDARTSNTLITDNSRFGAVYVMRFSGNQTDVRLLETKDEVGYLEIVEVKGNYLILKAQDNLGQTENALFYMPFSEPELFTSLVFLQQPNSEGAYP